MTLSPHQDHKHCPKCDTDKPLDEFAVHAKRGDGRSGWCRMCLAANKKAWAKKKRSRAVKAQPKKTLTRVPLPPARRDN